jgi:hypothetical protein
LDLKAAAGLPAPAQAVPYKETGTHFRSVLVRVVEEGPFVETDLRNHSRQKGQKNSKSLMQGPKKGH